MFLESLVYASILGLLVGGLTGLFLTPQGVIINHSKTTALVLNLGSGVYEELFFRLMFISGVVLLVKKNVTNVLVVYASAVFLSALAFSLFHYLAYFNEPFQVNSFLFRFFAGLVFAIIFIFRGYGIAAYSHSLYNIFLMFR